MRARLISRLLVAGTVLLTGTMLASPAGCGESGEGNEVQVTEGRPAPAPSEFPSSENRTLGEIVDTADPAEPTDPNVITETQVFYSDTPGANRYSFTLADRDRREITSADVALYTARVPAGEGNAFEEPANGPFPARLVSLATQPEHRSETTVENEYSATAFYAARVPFPRAGEWRVVAVIEHDGKTIANTLPTANVDEYRGIPRRGEKPPLIHTPVADDPGVEPDELTTREPPGMLQDADFAETIGSKPIALLFTSPRYCQSRVCAPVTDIADQVNDDLGNEVELIQMELYNRNDPAAGVRPQVRRFNLPSEPWLFLIDRTGTVHTAIEGPFGAGELESAAEEVSRR